MGSSWALFDRAPRGHLGGVNLWQTIKINSLHRSSPQRNCRIIPFYVGMHPFLLNAALSEIAGKCLTVFLCMCCVLNKWMWMWLLEGLSCWQTQRRCPLPLLAEWGIERLLVWGGPETWTDCDCKNWLRDGSGLWHALWKPHGLSHFFLCHSCFLRLNIQRIWKNNGNMNEY